MNVADSGGTGKQGNLNSFVDALYSTRLLECHLSGSLKSLEATAYMRILVVIRDRNGFPSGHKLMRHEFAHDVLVKGEVEFQIFDVAVISLYKGQRLVQIGV